MDFRDIIKVILRKMKFIVIFPVVFVMVVSCYVYMTQSPRYTSTTTLYLINTGSSASTSDVNYAEKLISDYVLLAKNSTVRENAAKALGESSVSAYGISVAPDEDTHVIRISATADNPATAANVANVYASCAITYLRDILENFGADDIAGLHGSVNFDAADDVHRFEHGFLGNGFVDADGAHLLHTVYHD